MSFNVLSIKCCGRIEFIVGCCDYKGTYIQVNASVDGLITFVLLFRSIDRENEYAIKNMNFPQIIESKQSIRFCPGCGANLAQLDWKF